MISKRKLLERIESLENGKDLTLSVPVVDKDGTPIRRSINDPFHYAYLRGIQVRHKLTFEEVCAALQDMCGIEITYQKCPTIKGKEGVVIYEKEE